MDIVTSTETVVLRDERIEIEIATGFGPRVTGLALAGGTNVFAELGDVGIDLEDGRRFTMRGGHRLWAAPEAPEVTYEPDDDPVVVTQDLDSVIVEQSATKIGKRLAITLQDATVVVEHVLRNNSSDTVRVAPWAITQFPIGGIAIVPLPNLAIDAHCLQASTSIALWPYTVADGLPFSLDDGLLLLDANRSTPTKFGTSLQRGWLAYLRGTTLFVKRATQTEGASYVDHGAAAQCYCNAQFLELETLGPLVDLAPNASTSHVEVWELHDIEPALTPTSIPRELSLDKGLAR